MDAILIRELRVEALIGIYKREQHITQTLTIDLEIGLPSEAVFSSDRVADTIDYEQVTIRIRDLAASGHFKLVETFADRIAQLLLQDFRAPWVKVSVSKMGVLANTRYVGVVLERPKPQA